MHFKKLLAALLVTFSFVLMPLQGAYAAAPEGTITFTVKDASGNTIGQASVPMAEAKSTSLAAFFSQVRDAIDKIIAALPTQESGEGAGTETQTVALSAKISVQITGTGFGGGSGGGVSASPN